jgi:hypothetical protein
MIVSCLLDPKAIMFLTNPFSGRRRQQIFVSSSRANYQEQEEEHKEQERAYQER